MPSNTITHYEVIPLPPPTTQRQLRFKDGTIAKVGDSFLLSPNRYDIIGIDELNERFYWTYCTIDPETGKVVQENPTYTSSSNFSTLLQYNKYKKVKKTTGFGKFMKEIEGNK